MSNPQTFYKVGGVDLSNIFQAYSGPPSGVLTKYNVPGYGDLNTIFAPYPGTGTKALVTGYTVTGYGDLNAIFAKYVQTQTFDVGVSGASSGNWSSIASDASGQLVAVSSGKYVYKSTDYGINLSQLYYTSTTNIVDVAVSSDGTIICFIWNYANNGYSITYNVATNQLDLSIAPTYNTTYVSVTITNGKHIYVLTNTGAIVHFATPTTTPGLKYPSDHPPPPTTYVGVCIASATIYNTIVFATSNTTAIYTSINNGSTQTSLTPISTPCTNIVSDGSGQHFAVTSYGHGLYTSNDSGNNWTRRFTDTQNWQAIASSSNGAVLIAGINVSSSTTGTVYISTDYGVNWSNQIFINGGGLLVSDVSAVSMSGDGTRFCVCVYGGTIYYGTITLT
jgi:hypothetical protein